MIKSKICLFLFFGFVCLMTAAQAATQTFNLSWTIPTTRADGTPLPVAELAGYNLYYKVDGGTEVKIVTGGGATSSRTVALNLAPRATAYKISWTMTAVDTGGKESGRSNELVTDVTVQNALPSPVSNVKITVTCAAGSCSMVVQ